MSATATTIEPGLHLNVPFADYLRWPFMSQSTLKQGRESMAHLKCALDQERRMEPTDAMILGSALHTAFLEPALFDTRVALWDGPRRVGAEWRAFSDEHSGKAILTPGMHGNLCGMVAALRRHPEVRQWVDRAKAVEVSCLGDLHGIPFKGRVDALTDDPIWDLKKTSTTDERAITSAILTYGYHIQAYCYMRLFGRERFCLGFVEEQPPHDVRVVELSPTWLAIAKQDVLGLIQAYQWCVEHDTWPGRSDVIETIEPPAWLSERYANTGQITIGGVSAYGEGD